LVRLINSKFKDLKSDYLKKIDFDNGEKEYLDFGNNVTNSDK